METTHYDRDELVFNAFLDPYRKFSSGLFSSEETPFESSVVDMLDYLLDSAGVSDGARVLEIGTGWGCLLKRLKERHPHAAYTGVSPSAAQNDYVREHVDKDAPIHACAFESAVIAGPFDAIFLSGTFCHIQRKPQQLARMCELLSANGRLVIEDTFFQSREVKEALRDNAARDSVQNAMFGWAELMPLSAALDIAETSGFRLNTGRDVTCHFAQTGKEWIRRLARADLPYADKKDMLTYLRLANQGWHRNALYYVLTFERRTRLRSAAA